MDDKQIRQLARETFESWNGEGSWAKASNWRKSDWRKMVQAIVEAGPVPPLPSEMPTPPQPVKPRPARPLRADALDENPD